MFLLAGPKQKAQSVSGTARERRIWPRGPTRRGVGGWVGPAVVGTVDPEDEGRGAP